MFTSELLTFTHLSDLLTVDVMALVIYESTEEVLETIVDLKTRSGQRDPFPDGVTLHVF